MFDILAINLNISRNYFDGPNEMIFRSMSKSVNKFLVTSNPLFPCINLSENILSNVKQMSLDFRKKKFNTKCQKCQIKC